MCHAEGRTTAAILLLAELAERPVHIAHVARKEEVRRKQHLVIATNHCLAACLKAGRKPVPLSCLRIISPLSGFSAGHFHSPIQSRFHFSDLKYTEGLIQLNSFIFIFFPIYVLAD